MSIIDTAKDIYDLAMKGATLELREQLLKMREEAFVLQEENIKLKTRVSELEVALSLRENLSFDGSVYWLTLQNGQNDGPYCQRCYDADGKLIRLQASSHKEFKGPVLSTWHCRACNKMYINSSKT